MKKQIKGCLTPNRNIFFIKDKQGKIVALSCLKKDEIERKICTLYVSNEVRKQGLGTLLFEESMRFLDTTKPLLTFTEEKLPMFEKMIIKYNWKLTEIVSDIYNEGVREFCFNGQLTNRNYKQKLIDVLKIVKNKADNELNDNEKIDNNLQIIKND